MLYHEVLFWADNVKKYKALTLFNGNLLHNNDKLMKTQISWSEP